MTPVQCTSLYEVQVVSRCLVKASNTSIEPHVVTVSNLDLITRIIQTSMFGVYDKPPAGDLPLSLPWTTAS